MDSISPCFYQKKKNFLGRGACPGRRSRETDDDAWCSPPPYPFPLPSLPPTFWGWSVPRMGAGRGWGRFWCWGRLPPPRHPFPTALFFRGVPREGGLREALRHPDLPRPLPHLSTPESSTLLARWNSGVERRGGGGRYRDQRPPYHPTYASNPHNAPAPTRTISGTLSQWPFSPRLTGQRAPDVVSGGGRGLGGWVVH